MIDYLPSSLRGLMVAAFAAAFMSTIATQLNWGASYLVNDFYRRFVRRDASEPHYVLASRLATALLTLISAAVAFRIESIGGAWKLLIITGAGTGAVLLLRWYWWRINAWSEVSAMITRSEEHTSELQSQSNLVCRLLLEKKKTNTTPPKY